MAASKYVTLELEVRKLLEDGLGGLLTSLVDGSGDHQPSLAIEKQLSKSLAAHSDLKSKLEKASLDVAVLALAKSGKSTFLNALTGASILPSNNVPETARIVALEHCQSNGDGPVLHYTQGTETLEIKGEAEIRTHLEILNKNVRSRRHSKHDEQILTVRTELAALEAQPTDLAVGLRLLDTPGPNEAGEDALRHSVERLLDSVDAVVYVLDYSKLKTQEETDLLTKLSKSNPQLIMRLASRLFFVVNKVDIMHVSEGLQEDELREYVADLVTTQMNFASFQLRPDQVLLVSAQDALLSRLIMSGKATDAERVRFGKKAFGRNTKNKTEADYQSEAEHMLEESHLLEVEDRLLGYLYNHAGSLKIVSILDGTAKLLTQMKNVAVTAEAAMKVSAEKLTEEVENLQASLATTSEEFKAVQRQAAAIEAEVVENVQQRMIVLKERLFSHINQVLDPDNIPSSPTAPGAQLSSWRRIWEKSAAFFLRTRSTEVSSDAALRSKLADLHNDIKIQIENEISDFWHGLETATNQTYQDLIAVINQHLLELARKIEGSVGKVLDLCLRPLDICLQRPSAEEFHSSIEALLSTGIRQGKRQLTKQRTVDHVEWQKKYRGLCNQTEYYIGVPTKRNEIFKEEIPVFSLDPESIKGYFHNMVQQSISVSIVNVKDYVHTFMSDQIAKAHAKISNYSALYSDAMTSALQSKSLTAHEQKANMAALKDNISAVDGLLKTANEIALKAASLFPKLDLDDFDWVNEYETDAESDYSDLAARLRDLPKLGSKGSGASGGSSFGPPKPAVPLFKSAQTLKPGGGSFLKDVTELAKNGQLPVMTQGMPAKLAESRVPPAPVTGVMLPSGAFQSTSRGLPQATTLEPSQAASAPAKQPLQAPALPPQAPVAMPPTSVMPTLGSLSQVWTGGSDADEEPLLNVQRTSSDSESSEEEEEEDESATSDDSSGSSDSDSTGSYSESYSESDAYSEADSYSDSDSDSTSGSSSTDSQSGANSEVSSEATAKEDEIDSGEDHTSAESSMYSNTSFADAAPAAATKPAGGPVGFENTDLLDTIPVIPIDISQLPVINKDLPVSQGPPNPAVVAHHTESPKGGASLYQPSSSSEDYADWECVSETDATSPPAQQ